MKLTTAQAIVRYLVAQRTVVDGRDVPLFPGVFAIFGHGNVTCLGQALEEARDELPTWRGQNEQGMALAAVGFAKATRRRQIMVATSSIGPGALNMVTAAGVAHSNRLPVLLLAGDTFQSRIPDPVLQQVEHFDDPTITVNDAFKPVSRYWDRLTRPEQVVHSLPHAVATMLDPANCGPAFIALPQDVQAEAYDFPDRFFERTVHDDRPTRVPMSSSCAVPPRSSATPIRPLIIAGGGVHYSGAEAELTRFAEIHNIPVVETVAGKASMLAAHPLNAGPIGVTGCTSANALAAEADVVISVGTRLQDFTTGSWTAFSPTARFVNINVAGFDAVKRLAHRRRRGCPRVPARAGPDRRRLERTHRVVRTRPPARPRRTTPTSTRSRRRPRAGCRRTPRSSVRSTASPSRATTRWRRRVGSRPSSTTVGGRRVSTASTASTGSRAWATRSPVRGGPRWRCPTARSSASSATART